jgi:transcriptional regulator with GAF, ATPase, and Fis domain
MVAEIHEHSERRNAGFIVVNCAALPEGLIESELFGYEKGAFTGALNRRAGKFEGAQSGTVSWMRLANSRWQPSPSSCVSSRNTRSSG